MPKDECAFGIRHDSYPTDANRHVALIWVNTKKVFIPGEHLNGVHTVDFLIS